MTTKKFLRQTDGILAETPGVVVSAGAPNAGDLPALDSIGKLDVSVMPIEVWPEVLHLFTPDATPTVILSVPFPESVTWGIEVHALYSRPDDDSLSGIARVLSVFGRGPDDISERGTQDLTLVTNFAETTVYVAANTDTQSADVTVVGKDIDWTVQVFVIKE